MTVQKRVIEKFLSKLRIEKLIETYEKKVYIEKEICNIPRNGVFKFGFSGLQLLKNIITYKHECDKIQ